MAYHDKFQPKNPSKYRGKLDKIEWRSLWEYKLMLKCDTSPNIIKWSSEEVIIPYFDPVKNRNRRYFMDFWVRIQKADGSMHEFLIEVKPAKEADFFSKAMAEGREPTSPRPKPTSTNPKVMQRWYAECCTAATNAAKWKAAIKYCKERNMKFMIFTERELGIDQGKAKTERKRASTAKYKTAQKTKPA